MSKKIEPNPSIRIIASILAYGVIRMLAREKSRAMDKIRLDSPQLIPDPAPTPLQVQVPALD
jgi:hypothetical protein